MQISRAYAFITCVAAAFLLPALIPSVGVDYTYLFIIALVLLAWFSIKWGSVKNLETAGGLLEILLGVAVVAAVYGYKIESGARFGILDLTIIFAALAMSFYGIKSFKLFWVPATYGAVLVLGYQLENVLPNYAAMQDWMAGLMASGTSALGITSSVSGHVVYLNSGANELALDVEGDCTGLQGILAFGLLSTMAVLDVKPKISRLVPIFAVGFLGAFLINLVRLFMVFLSFEYLGVGVGTEVHVYAGYTLFIVWVLAFWALAFRYLAQPSGRAGDVLSTGAPKALERPSG